MSKFKFFGFPKRDKRKQELVTFVMKYQCNLNNLGKIINQNLYSLSMKEVKIIFIPALMITLCSAKKLSSYLVKAKLYPLDRDVKPLHSKDKKVV